MGGHHVMFDFYISNPLSIKVKVFMLKVFNSKYVCDTGAIISLCACELIVESRTLLSLVAE